jgi:RNA polymerase sigma factor (sigma-70 family)
MLKIVTLSLKSLSIRIHFTSQSALQLAGGTFSTSSHLRETTMQEEARYPFVSAIATRYGLRLRRFFSLRLRNAVDAPDLAQEVFLRLMRVDHYESIRSPEAYLFTVASHVLHQHNLRQSAMPASLDISQVFAELQLSSGDDPLERSDGQQRLQGIARVLAQLPPKVSTALLLHRFGGLTIDEIGRELGVSRPAAKKYLARALTECRDALEELDGRDTRENKSAKT